MIRIMILQDEFNGIFESFRAAILNFVHFTSFFSWIGSLNIKFIQLLQFMNFKIKKIMRKNPTAILTHLGCHLESDAILNYFGWFFALVPPGIRFSRSKAFFMPIFIKHIQKLAPQSNFEKNSLSTMCNSNAHSGADFI